MMKFLIVDHDLSSRAELVALLAREEGISLVAEAEGVRQAIETARKHKPDVILLDIHLPDGSGLDAARAILAEAAQTQIVLLGVVEDEHLLEGFRMGVKGCLPKNIAPAKLLAAVRGMLRGEAPLSREMTARLIALLAKNSAEDPAGEDLLAQLTAREMEVLGELAGGLSNQQIAEKLFVSENTVRNHVHNILEKLGLRSRREAAALGKRYGMSPQKKAGKAKS